MWLNKDNYKDYLKGITIVEVSGESCANCLTLMPILNEIVSNQYKSMFTYKDRVNKYSDLPSSGNSIGDMYYVTTDENDNHNGAYVWEYDATENKCDWKYIGPITNFEFDDTQTESSLNAVTSDGIKKYVDTHGGDVSSLIDYIRISGETEDLPIEDKRVTLPLATQNRAGMITLGSEFDTDENGKLIMKRNADGTWDIPDNSISVTKLDIPEGTTLIIEDSEI